MLPTSVFIVGLLVIIAVGLIHPLGLHAHQPGRSLLGAHDLATVSVLLVLKAFSAGCSALTGVEAIAERSPAVQKTAGGPREEDRVVAGGDPRHHVGRPGRARHSLAHRASVRTDRAQSDHGRGGRPALGLLRRIANHHPCALAGREHVLRRAAGARQPALARDGYLPHLFALRGDRQVFANGIWALAILSGALLVAVGGNTNSLIPLFAIGVFIGFTLAQSGLVVHWWKERPTSWRRRAAVNGLGATMTGVATAVFLFSKFLEGAWVVVIAIPAFVLLFVRIHAYYKHRGARSRASVLTRASRWRNPA